MAPRRRSKAKQGWPDNLYESRGYFTYRNPLTGEPFGLGRDKVYAFNQAIEANLYLTGQIKKERLVDRIQGTAGQTVQAWKEAYDKILAARTLSPNTRTQYKVYSNKMVALLGADTKLRAVTPLQVSTGLRKIQESGTGTVARQLKSWLRDSFASAIVEGWLDENPCRDVKLERVTVKRARLTWELFQQIYAASADTWFQNALELGLVSGQARAELGAATFKSVRDGYWWVVRGKTQARVAIPLNLRLDLLGKSLEDVIRQCRQTGVVSPFLLHHTQRAGRVQPGHRISLSLLSCRFAEVLAGLKLDFGDKEPPTLHEVRSLAARLYKDQGNVSGKDLLAHSDQKTTEIYEDPRGEWIMVSASNVATV